MNKSGKRGLPSRHSVYDDPGPENVRSTLGWTALALVAAYVVGNTFLPNNDLNVAVSILVSATSTMCLCYYAPRAVYALWTGSAAPSDYLIVGVVLSWFSQDGQAVLSVMARLSGFSPVLMNSELFGIFKLITVLAAICHVVPRGAADGVVPRSDKVAVYGFLGVAILLAVAVLAIRPDPMPFIDRLPSWSRDFFQTGNLQTTGDPPA